MTTTGSEAPGDLYSVPKDPYIKLGYYLHCVACTDCPNEIPPRLRDFQDHRPTAHQTIEALREMITWVDTYSPEKMQAAGYFILLPDDSLGRESNKFMKFTTSSPDIGLVSGNRATLALIQNATEPVYVMVHIRWWENDDFHEPRRALIRAIEWRESEARRPFQAPQQAGPGPYPPAGTGPYPPAGPQPYPQMGPGPYQQMPPGPYQQARPGGQQQMGRGGPQQGGKNPPAGGSSDTSKKQSACCNVW
jgi:hypothetical protein